MGKVFRVHHTTWNVDLAMKQPHAKLFETEAQKQNFIRECEAWINLGLHPHIVSCYYVREIDGTPNIFAEWMDGGSLAHWIRSEKLYEGDDNVLERILDIAIQFAWGLDYAHEQGLIHQDVKPDNVLLTSDGDIKVADFGIAKAKAGLGLSTSTTSQFKGTMITEAGAYTPTYCSPEQANGGKLTRRTDIWSWAVSVMEMFVGERLWPSGSIAGTACNDYFDSARVPIPESVKVLLRECFREDETKRPRNFKVIAEKLLEIYRIETAREYHREIPKAAADAPDSLNNRALSYIDMGQPEQAERLWEQALKIDPSHLESTYNQGLYLWRSARIDDMELVRRLEAVRHDYTGSWRDEYLLAMVHLDRCDAESALPLLERAASQSNNDTDVAMAMEIAANLRGKGQCIRTFEGHTDSVNSVSFSPDGKSALTGSKDNTLKLWEIETGRCLRTFVGHTKLGVHSVSFSPDGKFILSGGDDNTLKMWDVETGKCLWTFEGHKDSVSSACFSPVGKYVISGSDDMTLMLWNMETGECLHAFEGHEGRIHSVSFSPDGTFVLSGSWDNTMKLWDLEDGECLHTFEGHTRMVLSVSFSLDSKYVLSGSFDNTMKLWNMEDGECLHTFDGHEGPVHSVSFSPDGKCALSGSLGTMLKLWDLEAGQCLRTFEGHMGEVTSVSFSPDGKYVLSGSYDRTMKLWDVPVFQAYADWTLCRIRTVQETLDHEQRFIAAFRETGKKIDDGNLVAALAVLATARSVPGFERSPQCLELNFKIGRYCRAIGLQAAWLERTFDGHKGGVTSVNFSAGGKYALSGSWDTTLKLWDVETGQCLQTFKGHTLLVNSVSFSPDSKSALSGSWADDEIEYVPVPGTDKSALSKSADSTMKLWNVATGKCLRSFKKHNGDVGSVSFSPTGKYALSGSKDQTLKLWDVETGECLRIFDGHTNKVSSVCFSLDGKYVISGSDDKTLKLWDMKIFQCLHTFEGHEDSICSVCFSPEGKLALSGSKDQTLKLWDVEDGECLHTFEGHSHWVNSVSFSPDGKYALSGSYDNTVKLWDVESGQCLRTFEGHMGEVTSVSFSPDGKYVLSGSRDNTLKFWRLDWNYEFPGWTDWDDGAKPYLTNFLTLHTPYAGQLPVNREPTEEEIELALTRRGMPSWTEDDFQKLLTELQSRGYGWLREAGVRKKLGEMTRSVGK